MILYLIKRDRLFKIGISDSYEGRIKTLENDFPGINWEESSYYSGEESDIIDLEKMLHRLFKKFNQVLTDGGGKTEWFDDSCYSEVINFVDMERENFDLSERTLFEIELVEEMKSKKQWNYLYFIVTQNNKSEIGKLQDLDISDYKSLDIIKEKSIIIKFKDTVACSNLFESMRLDIPNRRFNKKKFGISNEYTDDVAKLLKIKINILSSCTDLKLISLLNSKVVDFGSATTQLNSQEVCDILGISKQTLSNWRKSERIKFKQISPRIFLYQMDEVKKMLDLDLTSEPLLNTKPTKRVKYIGRDTTLKKKLPTSLPIDYKEKIREWVKIYSYQVTEQKYKKQNFFLNFGNVGFVSSPHVMITDDFKLFDYIKKVEIYSDEKEVWQYLENLSKEGKNPRIDTSKRIYSGFANLYLNKLYEPLERHN